MDTPKLENESLPKPEILELIEGLNWRLCRRPSRAEAVQLTKAIATARDDGWTLEQLKRQMNQALTEVKNPKKAAVYVLGAITEWLPMSPPPESRARTVAERVSGLTLSPATAALARAFIERRLVDGVTVAQAGEELTQIIEVAKQAPNPRRVIAEECRTAHRALTPA